MKNLLFLVVAAAVLSFGVAPAARAHEPRLAKDNQLIIIKNPDISQAFYGELKDREAYYLIDLKQEQDLYFQILVPDVPGIQKDKTVTIEYTPELDREAVNFAVINPGSEAWKNFYEEYAGDNYLEGPAIKKLGQPGYYIIKISSPDNTGKYVLAVGAKEEFPVLEMAKALIIIPQLKTKYFNLPVWQSFNGKIGKYFGVALLIVLIFGYMFRRFHQVYK